MQLVTCNLRWCFWIMDLISATVLTSKVWLDNFCRQCTDACIIPRKGQLKHRHCTLCKQLNVNLFHSRRHFMLFHVGRAVKHAEFTCLPCQCSSSKTIATRSHYHCPYCAKFMERKSRFLCHLKWRNQTKPTGYETMLCNEKKRKGIQVLDSMNKHIDTKRTKNAVCMSSDEDFETKLLTKCIATKKDQCHLCGEMMQNHHITRHCREKHNIDLITCSVCVILFE